MEQAQKSAHIGNFVLGDGLCHKRGRKALIPGHYHVCNDRHGKNCHQHKHTLNKVGGANSLKAAQQGIYQNNYRRNGKTDGISVLDGIAEQGSKQLCARAERRRRINCKEYRDDDRSDNLDNASLVAVAVFKKAWDSQRVARYNRVFPQSGRNQEPVEHGAYQKTDGYPHLAGTGKVYGARKSHKQPAAHVGRLRRKRRCPAAKVSAAQEIVFVVFGFL